MAAKKTTETIEVEIKTNEDGTEMAVPVEEKKSILAKAKETGSKVVHSKPAKIIGGAVLALGAGIVGYALGSKQGDDNLEYYVLNSEPDDSTDNIVE